MMPGVPNASMARQVERLGFDAVYISGAGMANATAGVPDIGLLTLTEVVQLAGYIAKAVKIPAIVDAVGDRCEVYLDSGIRRGTAILTALALGARAVLIGRPLVYGLGAAGEAGARRAFELLRGELATALALAGYPRIAELGPDVIRTR